MTTLFETAARPILKWAGGKRELLPEILKRSPVKFGKYIEPFFGGGAVYLHLAASADNRDQFAINDVNEDLIAMYRDIKSRPHELISGCHELEKVFWEKGYYHIRSHFNGIDSEKNPVKRYEGLQRSCAIIVLNRTCFNGLYRTNKSGLFNVPKGNYKNPRIIDPENTMRLSELLPEVENIHCGQFDAIENIKPGDFVYFDPPYVPLSATSNFTDYSEAFGLQEQQRLRDYFLKLDNKGVYVLASNSSAPLVADLYAEFRIDEVECRRNVNSKASGRKKVAEFMILGKTLEKCVS